MIDEIKASDILIHLEGGHKIRLKCVDDAVLLSLADLEGWDYDPILNPNDYELIEASE